MMIVDAGTGWPPKVPAAIQKPSTRALRNMTSRMFIRRMGGALFVLPVAAMCIPALAADESLDEVIVVATRLPVKAERIGNTVSVLAQKAIEDSQAVVT